MFSAFFLLYAVVKVQKLNRMFSDPEPPPVRETRLNVRVEQDVPRTFQGV